MDQEKAKRTRTIIKKGKSKETRPKPETGRCGFLDCVTTSMCYKMGFSQDWFQIYPILSVQKDYTKHETH